MSGELPRLDGHAGKLFRASEFNTIEAREARFPAGGADTYYADDELACNGFTGSGENLQPGELENKVWFAPADWPRPGMLLRRPRVIRMVLMAGSINDEVYYPGDPQLADLPNAAIPAALFDEVAPALEAATAGTDVLFVLHHAWLVGGSCRFLRPLVPTALAPGEFLAADVLNLLFLYEARTDAELLGAAARTIYLPWNFAFDGEGDYNLVDGGGVHAGLNATFSDDAAKVAAAYPGFPRYRTVLHDCDPGGQGVASGGGVNDALIESLALTSSNNAAQLAEVAAELAASGFEYGGAFDPLTEGPAAIAALAAAHFDL